MLVVWVTSATFHLETSALKAPALSNTTHHTKRRHQWTRERWRARKDAKQQTAGGELKRNQKNKSVTPSNETNSVETEVDVLYRMSVTSPVSHLEMSALKAAAFLNTTHHPKRRKEWAGKVEGKKGCKKHTAGGELKRNQNNKSVTPSNEQTVLETEVDVLLFMVVTLDTSHSPIAPYDDDAHAEPSPELPTHEFTAVFNSAKSIGANTAPTETVPQTPRHNITRTKGNTHNQLAPPPPPRQEPEPGPPVLRWAVPFCPPGLLCLFTSCSGVCSFFFFHGCGWTGASAEPLFVGFAGMTAVVQTGGGGGGAGLAVESGAVVSIGTEGTACTGSVACSGSVCLQWTTVDAPGVSGKAVSGGSSGGGVLLRFDVTFGQRCD